MCAEHSPKLPSLSHHRPSKVNHRKSAHPVFPHGPSPLQEAIDTLSIVQYHLRVYSDRLKADKDYPHVQPALF